MDEMNESWKSTPPDCRPISALSPLTCFKPIDPVITPGIVARRVLCLQNLSNPSSSTTSQVNFTTRRRENSRTGFGRRLHSRFGLPALQSHKPDEQPQIEAAHSFCGLRTPRTKHAEEHANAELRELPDGQLTMKGELKPRGSKDRRQYDIAAPWAALSRSKSSRSMGRKISSSNIYIFRTSRDSNRKIGSPDFEVLTGINSASDQSQLLSQSSIILDLGSNGKQQNNDGGSSITTTSTIRRKSVRDLFLNHRIEKPKGLASSEGSRLDSDNMPRILPSPYRCCHCYSSLNESSSVATDEPQCWKCGHISCFHCQARSVSIQMRKEGGFSGREQVSKDSQENFNPSPEAVSCISRGIPIRPGPRMMQSNSNTRKVTGRTMEVQPRPRTASHQSSVPFWPGTQVTTSIKDSPFLVADVLYTKRSPGAPPSKVDTRADCERVRQSRVYHDPTDNGYMADASVAGSSVSRRLSQHQCCSRKPSSKSLPERPRYSKCLEAELRWEPVSVEYHGYPRTGHSHHGSPITTGIVGECQHCLDDCQCAACQNTHHSVRCCVYNDHQSIVHHHFIPRVEQERFSIPDATFEASSNVKSAAKPSLDAGNEIRPGISAKHHTETSLSSVISSSRCPSHLEIGRASTITPQSQLKRSKSKPRNKSIRHKESIPARSHIYVSNKHPRIGKDEPLKVEPPAAVSPLFKVRPNLPPPSICDRSSHKDSDTSMSASASIPSDQPGISERTSNNRIKARGSLEPDRRPGVIPIRDHHSSDLCTNRFKGHSGAITSFLLSEPPTAVPSPGRAIRRQQDNATLPSTQDGVNMPPSSAESWIPVIGQGQSSSIRAIMTKPASRGETGVMRIEAQDREHDCIWKRRYDELMAKGRSSMGKEMIKCVKVILSMEGGEDVMFVAGE